MTMTAPDLADATDGLFVLETWDGDAFLGELSFRSGFVVVHTGYRGRPPMVASEDVEAIVPASEHPDVMLEPHTA